MAQISLKVNGARHTVEADPACPLLYVLNDDLGLRGPRFGCGMGQCGACTVIAGGQTVRSCLRPVGSVAEAEVLTLDGLGTPEEMHPLQRIFVEEGAAQCGYCLSGVILTAKALFDAKPDATDEDIRVALGGILCRCFTHIRMVRAIRRYRETRVDADLSS